MRSTGLMLMALGAVLLLVGAALTVLPRIPFLGRLPGDLHYQGARTSVFFPITTCILLSLLLTAIVNFVSWLLRR